MKTMLAITMTALFLLAITSPASAQTKRYRVLATCYYDKKLLRSVCSDKFSFKIDHEWISRAFEKADKTVSKVSFSCNKKLNLWVLGLVEVVSNEGEFPPYTYLAWVPKRNLTKTEAKLCGKRDSSMTYQPEPSE